MAKVVIIFDLLTYLRLPFVEYIVTDLLKALLGSIPVSTFQHTRHATVLWKCFLRIRAWTVAIQRMRGDVTQLYVWVT
jgi:hypothetical protein